MYANQKEADIEDLIGREAYLDLVHRKYELAEAQRLPAKRPASAPIRVVKEVESHFATLPPRIPEFDHFGPAECLTLQGISPVVPELDAALDHFERLFKDLNSMLP